MIKIRLKPTLLQNYSGRSIQSVARGSGISYPTFFAMVKGKWNTTCLDVLAKFLDALGFDAAILRETKFSEIFTIEETSNE